MATSSAKSPRTSTPIKTQSHVSKHNLQAETSTPVALDPAVYIELDPFAPPPRLSMGSNFQSPAHASTPQKMSKADLKAPLPNYSGGILFEQLNSSGIALKNVVNEWMTMYESESERKETVSLLLINLILWSSRVEEDIKPENLIIESASQILHDLQEKIEFTTQSKADFPLIERNKKHRVFRTQFSDFWINLASLAFPAISNLELVEKVILPWLISMTSAAYRPIRYAATIAVLNIVQGCCKACVSMQKELETSSRVMNSKKGISSKRSIEATSARIAEIEKLMQLSIDAVFVQRYRDVDALLREKCVESIHSWIMIYPEVFLDNAYVRYIGWSLSDKVSQVRLASLAAWNSMCSRVEFRAALTNFVNRFKSRLFEVLTRDVDKQCRQSAGAVVDILFTGSFLEAQEMTCIDDLIFSGDSTISTMTELMSQRIFNLPSNRIVADNESLDRFAVFIAPFINAETSAETNNFILTKLIAHLSEQLPVLSDRTLCASFLKSLIAQVPESTSDSDESMEPSETSEKISCLLAVLFAQIQTAKLNKSSWKFEDSAELFNFVNDFIKFINDNEREIYSKDIFYLFSLLNEVELSDWMEIAGLSTWDHLLPILTELFCSIDDLESAKVALGFFKKAKSVGELNEKVMDCIKSGKDRLLNELLRRIPGNMREAIKIKDNTILTLVLPLAHINLLCPLELDDSVSVLASILNMNKLIQEFVDIEDVYKTIIWTCSLKLVFHELMWKMLEYRRGGREEDCQEVVDLKDRLVDLIGPADCIPEAADSLTLDGYERACTGINLLSDLALLFSGPSGSVQNAASWNVVILEDQILALGLFVKLATKIAADPLPKREHESFELARAVKKSFPVVISSMAKLFSLEAIPNNQLSTLFMTFGFGGEVSDTVIKVILDRIVRKMPLDQLMSIVSSSLQESYLMSVMSSEYERLVSGTTIALAKLFNEQLRASISTTTETSGVVDFHCQALDFFNCDRPQRSEFLGRIASLFTWALTPKQAEQIIAKTPNNLYSDTFTKSYTRSLEKINNKANLAQRLLSKRSNASSESPQKTNKLESIMETETDEFENDDDEKAIDYVAKIDLITQKEEIVAPSSPPAMLKRKVTRY
jgi:hypothetical protein